MYIQRIKYLIIFFFFALGLNAQDAAITDTIHSMREIVVVARPFQEVIPSQKISDVQLEKLNAHSVADALRYFSGVQLKDYGGMGGLKTIDVRNMGSHHVGVFYDGIQLGNAQNGVVDLGKYSLDDIEEISLYNGQKSEIFQSAKDFASASSIYIRSKRPRFKEGKNTNIRAKYKFGSIHLVNPSIRIEQKLSKQFNMSLSGEYIQSGGEYKFKYKAKNNQGQVLNDTTAYRKNSDIEAYRIETGVNGVVADGYLETKIYYYGSKRGLPGPILNNVFEHGDRLQDKNFFGQSSYTRSFTDRYKLKLQAKYAFDYSYHKPYEDKYYQHEYYISAINKYSIQSWWDIALSADYQHSKLNATKGSGREFSYPSRHSTFAALANSFDFGRFKAQASALGTFVQESVKSGAKMPNKTKLAPAIFLSYQPFDNHNLNLRAFYKNIFRMPTFNDLYYGTDFDHNIRPETTNQFNIGFTYNKPFRNIFLQEINFQLDTYYNKVSDKIVSVPKGDGFRWSTTNIGKVDIKGLEARIGADAEVNKLHLNTNLAYTYQKAQNVTDERLSSYKDLIPYSPKHSLSALFNTDYDSWSFNYSYIYVGARYHSNNIKAYELEPFHSHDISVQKEIKIKNLLVKGTIEMNNALNQYRDVIINYPMPGRTFKFIINIEL